MVKYMKIGESATKHPERMKAQRLSHRLGIHSSNRSTAPLVIGWVKIP
nr:MAG TPA: hypothetical protein [Caudoviricetes sp.]